MNKAYHPCLSGLRLEHWGNFLFIRFLDPKRLTKLSAKTARNPEMPALSSDTVSTALLKPRREPPCVPRCLAGRNQLRRPQSFRNALDLVLPTLSISLDSHCQVEASQDRCSLQNNT